MANKIGSDYEGEALTTMRELEPSQLESDELVMKKATCPFLASAIATHRLPVHNHAGNPLADVDDVRKLGNTGGGNLGSLLGFFAAGNHGKMRGPTGHFDTPVPPRFFSLDLPGSQGSHAGHSGILQGDPTQLASGRFSEDHFRRFLDKGRDGLIRRSDIACFIADNVSRDANSKFFPVSLWAKEGANLVKAVLQYGMGRGRHNTIRRPFASILGSIHLIGSAGEFGLLLAFLHNSPQTLHVPKADPAFSIEEITLMFRGKELPDGWETWKKTWWSWIRHTFRLASKASFELIRLRRLQGSLV